MNHAWKPIRTWRTATGDDKTKRSFLYRSVVDPCRCYSSETITDISTSSCNYSTSWDFSIKCHLFQQYPLPTVVCYRAAVIRADEIAVGVRNHVRNMPDRISPGRALTIRCICQHGKGRAEMVLECSCSFYYRCGCISPGRVTVCRRRNPAIKQVYLPL